MTIPFYIYDFKEVLVTIFLSVLSCLIAIESSRRIQIYRKNQLYLIVSSVLLGFTFWLTHTYVAFTLRLPFSPEHYIVYFVINLFLYVVGSYIALYIAQTRSFNQKRFLITGIFIGLITIGADIGGFFILFRDLFQVKVILLIMSSLLTLGTAFSILRFLIQITNEELFTFEAKWKYIGCILAGSSFAGIPYIMVLSVLDTSSLPYVHSNPYVFLVPFVYMINANLFLLLGPDYFGEEILSKITARYKSLENHNPNAVFTITLDGTLINVNEQATKLTGYSDTELVGRHSSLLLKDGTTNRFNMILQSVQLGDASNIESKLKRKDGSLIDVKITAIRIIIDQDIMGVYGIVEDITENKRAEEMILHLAYNDELTNLPNRRKLKEDMDDYIQRNIPFSIYLLDFDKFKRINDNFGHTFGDWFLRGISKRLSASIDDTYTAYRLGGDEFLIIAPYIDEPTSLADQIIGAFRQPLTVKGVEILTTASLGIASFPEHSNKYDELIKFADISMYHAKANGANSFTCFSQGLLAQQINLSLENELRKAISEKELEVYYQAKFDSNTETIIGGEALLRWNHKSRGFIPPGEFIPLAEEVGLIVQIETYVIREVCKSLKNWMEKGLYPYRISINISLVSLLQEDFIDFVFTVMNQSGITGSLLEFEITERMMMKNEGFVNASLQRLRDAGIEISIDDFGTGYSSLSYLHKLNVDRLKIDKSFIDMSDERTEIISTIINVAQGLNLKVIAEGVETRKQVDTLKMLGCHEVQGYYYSRPVPSKDYEAQLNEQLHSRKPLPTI